MTATHVTLLQSLSVLVVDVDDGVDITIAVAAATPPSLVIAADFFILRVLLLQLLLL